MKNLLYILGGLLWMSGASVGAQESPSQLTLEQALDLALQQNQEIQIQQKRLEIADNNVYPGKAGLLPQINFIADASYANNLSDARIRTFQESPAPAQINIDERGVETRTLSALVQADYVFFAGFSGRYRYKLLQNEQGMARYQQEVLVNNTALAVAEIFLEISKLQGRETLLKESIKLTQNRLEKLKDRFQFGKTTGLEILRGESDLNQDRNTLDQI
ncbi:MAG: TolC family protein, partial [Bacteroidota bacterium]